MPRAALLAVLGGVVVLATAGAPQSLGSLLRVGTDSPSIAGTQLAVGLSGAAAIAGCLFARRFWRVLLPAGAVGVLVASAIHLPVLQEVSVRVPGEGAPVPDAVAHPVAACLLGAASGVLLVGLLGAVESIQDQGPSVGIVAVAAYCGAAVVGPLVDAAGPVRLAVTAVATLLTTAVFAVKAPDSAGGRVWPAAVVVFLPLVSTAFVAASGRHLLGTTTGGMLGILLVALALAAAGGLHRVLAVAACGLALAAPATLLLFLHSSLATGRPWYVWPLGLIGVLSGAAARKLPWAGRAAVLAAIPTAAVGLQIGGESRTTQSLLTLAFLITALAAVAAATSAAAPREELPAFATLVTTAAVGFGFAAGLFTRRTSGPLDPSAPLVSAGYFLVAAALLAILGKRLNEEP